LTGGVCETADGRIRHFSQKSIMKTTKKRIKLDWNKLIGFNQAEAAQTEPSAKRTKSMVGKKVAVGVKPG
jgi:hypothetical protein